MTDAARRQAEVPCGVCGGQLVTVRGRMVPDPPRIVCPTCLADRMDIIRQYADRDYGRPAAQEGGR